MNARTTAGAAVRLDRVGKVYGTGPAAVTALDVVSFAFSPGTFTAVMGQSGSGKSTLLQLAAGLLQPSSGRISVGGADITGMRESELSVLRRERIGFVFQSFNLLPALTAKENIELPVRLAGRRPDPDRVRELIERTGLGAHAYRRPHELSGGQQQRVALARALVAGPQVVFADEPTGNLDLRSGHEILAVLRQIVDGLGQTVVMVTHDPGAAAYADRVLFLTDGRLVDTVENPTPQVLMERLGGQLGSPGVTRPAS
jgi:putative ABC transport system ATP-binding protein